MGSILVAIREMCSKYSPQVDFAEDNDMIGTLPPNAFIQSFNIRILPGTSIDGQYLFYLHRLHAPSKQILIDTISIPKQKSGRGDQRECFENLLRGPFDRWIRPYVEVNIATPGMTQNDEYK